MRTAPRTDGLGSLALSACAAAIWGLITVGAAQGQSSSPVASLAPPPTASAGTSEAGGLDMDANPTAPLAIAPTGQSATRDNVQDSLSPAGPQPDHPSAAAVAPLGSTPASGAVPEQPLAPEPVSLDHPTVVDTATFQAGETVVALYGIEGVKGEMAEGLEGFLTSHGNHMTCQAQSSSDFVCLQSDGTDVAEVALVNGAARTKPDAPAPYRDQEAAAQSARRGIWADLPPPPATIKHPTVTDTATMVADGQTYVLDGVQGLPSPFSGQLQSYIAQHGDSLTCNPQGATGHYVCLMDDGTDIAKTALVNGAARVAADAPDSYRAQQLDALNNHRGFWVNQSQETILANTAVVPQAVCCALPPGDDGADGLVYVAGAPTTVIDGETAFIVYGGDAGWGYYDHWHHWRGVPDRYRAHLDHFHPYGHGLRGYGHEEAFHREAAYHRDEVVHRDEAFHRQEAFHREEAFRPGGVHPGMAGPVGRPGMAAPGMRPGGGFAAVHPAAAGGGFVHPGPSLGGFHPGGMPAMAHATPAMRVAPAMHAAPAVASAGKRH